MLFTKFPTLSRIFKNNLFSSNITWSHYIELLSFDDVNKIEYYIKVCISSNLSVRQLREKIKSNEYERLPKDTITKLINEEDINVKDMIKNPIIVKSDKEIISEKVLQKVILEDIPSFLEELGGGFTFVKNEYPIRIGNYYNYIDLLLFNIQYNCYVVIELKITELKKEHIGQIQVYMNYIDDNLKTITQDKTVGIIICKKDNRFIMQYCSDNRIISREYITI